MKKKLVNVGLLHRDDEEPFADPSTPLSWQNNFIRYALDVQQRVLQEDIRRTVDEIVSSQEFINKLNEIMTHYRIEPAQHVRSKGSQVYEDLRDELEQKYLGKVVAIDLDSKKVVGVGDNIEEAYSEAARKVGKKKFYFREVGKDYIVKV